MILFSREILAKTPGATIIAEVKCSQTLFDDIEKHGGKPLMWKAGHSLIKAKMKETDAALAGEMSGHIFFADRFYGFDDATYAGARLLEILSKTDKPLSALLADLPKTFSTPELRVDCSDETKFDIVAKNRRIFRTRSQSHNHRRRSHYFRPRLGIGACVEHAGDLGPSFRSRFRRRTFRIFARSSKVRSRQQILLQ